MLYFGAWEQLPFRKMGIKAEDIVAAILFQKNYGPKPVGLDRFVREHI